MSAIDSGVAAGPAKYTAGSPGSTRVSRNVTTMTPISVGITVIRRVARLTNICRFSASPPRTGRGKPSGLHDRAVIDLTVEPVAVAGNIGLGRHVQVRLKQRD